MKRLELSDLLQEYIDKTVTIKLGYECQTLPETSDVKLLYADKYLTILEDKKGNRHFLRTSFVGIVYKK